MRWRSAALAIVLVAGACSNPKYAFDEEAVRSRIEGRTGISGEALDESVDEARRICKIEDLNAFQCETDRLGNLDDDGIRLNDVVTGCSQRFD
jgi:hypothetical protein